MVSGENMVWGEHDMNLAAVDSVDISHSSLWSRFDAGPQIMMQAGLRN